MVFAIARLGLMGFVVLSIVYVLVSIYSRSVRREKLEKRWEEEGIGGDREDFVRAGLAEYDGSVRRKLILGVYVVPVIVVGTLIYAINYW
ncbi:hypothetical protein [Oceaniglobus trochenteri]|uniref:hypothetical protein n=1 Tax=Oceaniglobus trochenteri TaxID=2763260 RepID=UPI001CFFCBDB|nr:hypothetical protein [Oceaniglobus trochenteri]